MRKLYLLMLSLFVATTVAQAAADLYIRGAQYGWNAEDCTEANKMTTEDGNVYTFETATLSSGFKIADNEWETYNYGYSSAIEPGGTYTLTNGSNSANICTSTGGALSNVKLTFTISTQKLVVEGAAAEAEYPEGIYLVGDFNEWIVNDADYKMTHEGDGKYVITGVNIESGKQLKFCDGSWSNSWGCGSSSTLPVGTQFTPVYDGGNYTVSTALVNATVEFLYDIYSYKDAKITITNVEVTPDPVDPTESDDTLSVLIPKMEADASQVVEVYLNSAEGNEYCSGQWDIVVPTGFAVSEITLNADRVTDHTLITNETEGAVRCIVYSATNSAFADNETPLFTFMLTADNASVGNNEGKISNISFNIVPTADNLDNIKRNFADVVMDIEVVNAVKSITATPNDVALNVGDTQTFELTITPEDATDSSVTWTVESGEDLIEIDPENGTVTALYTGVATIKITANDGFGAYTTIDITIDGKPVEKIELDIDEHTMYVGETVTLTATVTPDDASNRSVRWESSDENIATVDENGVVTGVGAGEAVITAIARDGSNVQASCAITIKAKISGDANGDDVLTIEDIVIIAKTAIELFVEGAVDENMDIDGDGVVTATDVTLAVYYLNLEATNELPEHAEMSADMLTLTNPVEMLDGTMNIPMYLACAEKMAGLQFDVVVPEGIELTQNSYVAPEASNSHGISVCEIAANTYRVIIYSAFNFKNDALGYLNVRNASNIKGNADFDINNVRYSDGYVLKATDDSRVTLNLSTSIDSLFADGDARYDVYNTAGVLVAAQADRAAVNALPNGVYVVNGTKILVY